MKRTSLVLTLAAASLAFVPFVALANNISATGTAGFTIGGAGIKASATTTATIETRAKARADQEIDRRIKNLTDLSSRIGEMKRLSSDQKASFTAAITAQITVLTALKAQIDAETVLTSLKTEIQSITKEYRIYQLIMPQVNVTAAADRIETVVGTGGVLDILAGKLETRINATTTANTATLKTLLADMKAKMASANTLAQAAVTEIVALVPDNGDASIQAANKTALADARAKIKSATEALHTAVADSHKIIAGLKVKGGEKMSGNASTSATVH